MRPHVVLSKNCQPEGDMLGPLQFLEQAAVTHGRTSDVSKLVFCGEG